MKDNIEGPAVCTDTFLSPEVETKSSKIDGDDKIKPFDWSQDKDVVADNAHEKLRAELRGMSDAQISERNKRRADTQADLEEIDRKMAERMKREEEQRIEDAKPLNRISNFFRRMFKR